MTKKGCLNCHFLCSLGEDKDGRPCVNSAKPKLRSREGLVAQLKEMARIPHFPSTIKCFCDNWNATEIGKENTDEIISAVFRPDRAKCPMFSKYDKYATPSAVNKREDLKLEKIDKRIALILSVFSVIVSILSPLIAYLTFLRM